jgi:hypothetical protein
MSSTVDTAVLGFGLVYYAFLCIVFTLRAYARQEEYQLKYVFSLLLIPCLVLLGLNLLGNQLYRSITLVPLLAFLVYDLWYRAITERKPLHHPEKWPWELVVYVLLLYGGSIGLNWYGYLVSKQYGNILVAGFFAMMASYTLYQIKYNRRKNREARNIISDYS